MTSDLLIKQQLGEFETTPLGIGTARLGAFWQKRSIAEGTEALTRALDLGVGLIDTADVYARGLSERIVGKTIAHRPHVVVMTKVGLIKTPRGIINAAKAGENPGLSGFKAAAGADTCFAPDYIELAAQRCMKRQGKAELDILLLHEPTAETFARDEVLEKLNSMKARGMIRAWGASVRDSESAVAATQAEGLRWLQIPTNLGNTEVLDQVNRQTVSADIVKVGLAVLGDGCLLPTAFSSGMSRGRAVSTLVNGVYELEGIDAVLLGMSRPQHVLENLAAINRGVSTDDLSQLRNLLLK